MWIDKQNKQKLGFLGNGITHARIGLRTQNPYPENLKTQKQSKTLKQQTSNLTYTKYEKN